MMRRCMRNVLHHSFGAVFTGDVTLVLFACGLSDGIGSIVVYLLCIAPANTSSIVLNPCGLVMTPIMNSCMWTTSSSSWSSVNFVS